MGSRHTRRIKKQRGGQSIDIHYVVAYIYTYLSSHKYKYRTFRNAESVVRHRLLRITSPYRYLQIYEGVHILLNQLLVRI